MNAHGIATNQIRNGDMIKVLGAWYVVTNSCVIGKDVSYRLQAGGKDYGWADSTDITAWEQR